MTTSPYLLIAEVGSVHDGSFGNAQKLIETAADCGADAVKFQTHIADAETLSDAPAPSYFKEESRMEYFKRTGFTLERWKQLKAKADECNVLFLSSPFSLEAVDMLEEVGIPMYKIPSGEVTNLPLLEKIAQLGKPVIISSGMNSWAELDTAVKVYRECCELIILQCSSIYPCPPEHVGLNILNEIRVRYGCAVGFSDHTLGMAASIASAALGATVIEKHFTFSRQMYGSDARHSMEPEDFRQMAKSVREVWTMLKHPVNKNDVVCYQDMKRIFQKSIVAAVDLKAGTVIEMKHLSFKKPGNGISPGRFKEIIGRKLKYAVISDYKLSLEDME